jgi:hypothetical protein
VHPVYPVPPHCPQRGAVHIVGSGGVVIVDSDVVVARVGTVVVISTVRVAGAMQQPQQPFFERKSQRRYGEIGLRKGAISTYCTGHVRAVWLRQVTG